MLKNLIVFMTSLFLVSGCGFFNPISPIISIGIMWYQGEAAKYYSTDQEIIHLATKNVLNEFKIPIISESVSGNIIYIKAGDDDRFKIKIISVREKVTKLAVRVNTFGDKPYVEMIYRHVDKEKNVEQFATAVMLNNAMTKQKRIH